MFQTTNQPFSIHGGSWVCKNHGKSSSIFGELSTLWLCKKGPYATDRSMAARAGAVVQLWPETMFFGGEALRVFDLKIWIHPKNPMVDIGELWVNHWRDIAGWFPGMYWMTLQRHRSTNTYFLRMVFDGFWRFEQKIMSKGLRMVPLDPPIHK